MDLSNFYLIYLLSIAGLLVALYTLTLIKECQGSKYKVILAITIMLLLSNVFLLMVGISEEFLEEMLMDGAPTPAIK